MTDPWRMRCTVVATLAVFGSCDPIAWAQQSEAKRPTINVRTTPAMGFTPLRVRAAAELRDGSDDYADFYCATAEWDWGDGTVSENTGDCDPYQAGKSTIERSFRSDHVYRQAGSYRIAFRLKQKSRVVGSGVASVQVRSGAGDGFGQ